MRERLEGLKIAELGRSEEEVLVLARRMIQMGQAAYDRILTAETASETTYIEGGPKTREVVLCLPFFEFITLKLTKMEEHPVDITVTYHPHGKLFNEYENIELGTVGMEHLVGEPADAAAQLTYVSSHIEDGPKWAFLIQMIKTAKERTELMGSGTVQ